MSEIKTASMASDGHDHQACTTEAIKTAENHCIEHKLKFTPIRRKVLEILLEENRAIGAYAILEKLRLDGFSSQPGETHTPAFMICRQCDAVEETESEESDFELSKIAKSSGFKIEQTVIEAEGVCHICTGS